MEKLKTVLYLQQCGQGKPENGWGNARTVRPWNSFSGAGGYRDQSPVTRQIKNTTPPKELSQLAFEAF